MTDYINYINGKWLSESDSKISIYDGGFLLGDGLFETIRFDDKNLFYVDKHLDRLNDGLDTIRITLLQSNTEIKQLLNHIIKLNICKSDAVVKTRYRISVKDNFVPQRGVARSNERKSCFRRCRKAVRYFKRLIIEDRRLRQIHSIHNPTELEAYN